MVVLGGGAVSHERGSPVLTGDPPGVGDLAETLDEWFPSLSPRAAVILLGTELPAGSGDTQVCSLVTPPPLPPPPVSLNPPTPSSHLPHFTPSSVFHTHPPSYPQP